MAKYTEKQLTVFRDYAREKYAKPGIIEIDKHASVSSGLESASDYVWVQAWVKVERSVVVTPQAEKVVDTNEGKSE